MPEETSDWISPTGGRNECDADISLRNEESLCLEIGRIKNSSWIYGMLKWEDKEFVLYGLFISNKQNKQTNPSKASFL